MVEYVGSLCGSKEVMEELIGQLFTEWMAASGSVNRSVAGSASNDAPIWVVSLMSTLGMYAVESRKDRRQRYK